MSFYKVKRFGSCFADSVWDPVLHQPEASALSGVKIEIFTKAEAAEMLNCLQEEDLMFRTFIQLAIITGARRGELAALKFSDFDFDKCQLTISRAAIKLKDQEISIKPPKDYEIRTVTVNRRVTMA